MLPGFYTEKEGHIDEKENRYILSRYDGCRRSLRFCSQPLRRRTERQLGLIKSVVELADAGIIQGVDGSYFQGERNITRYEAAEMVAKAMAHMDKASVEQRALINKLADEYADELNNLGVRVSALENPRGQRKTQR